MENLMYLNSSKEQNLINGNVYQTRTIQPIEKRIILSNLEHRLCYI